MKFNFGSWAIKLGASLLALFGSGGKLKANDVAQIAAGSAADELAQDNQPKP